MDVISRADGKFYSFEGELLPSVTTVLSACADTSWLEDWRASIGAEEAAKVSAEAAAVGSAFHEMAAAMALGLPDKSGPGKHRELAGFCRLLLRKVVVLGAEVQLAFPGLYAGTADLIGLWNGKLAVADYKTSRRHKTAEDLRWHRAQCAAYALALEEVVGLKVEVLIVAVASRFGAHVVDVATDWSSAARDWEAALFAYINRS